MFALRSAFNLSCSFHAFLVLPVYGALKESWELTNKLIKHSVMVDVSDYSNHITIFFVLLCIPILSRAPIVTSQESLLSDQVWTENYVPCTCTHTNILK